MLSYIVTQNKETKAYLLQVQKGSNVTDVAMSNDLMELLAIVYEMAEPESVKQNLGAGLQ